MTNLNGVETNASVAAFGSKMVMLQRQASGLGRSLSLDGGGTWRYGAQFGGDKYVGSFESGHSLCVDDTGRFYCAGRWGAISPTYGLSIGITRGMFQDTTLTWESAVTLAIPTLSYSYGIGPDFLKLLSDPQAGYLYLAYTETNGGTGSNPLAEGIVKFVRSADQGSSWSLPTTLSGSYCNGSRAALGPDGEIYVVWQDFATHQIVGRKSVDQGASFAAPFVVGAVVENLFLPVEWWGSAHLTPGHTDLRNGGPQNVALAVDRSAGTTRGRLYVAWTERAEGVALPVTSTIGEVEPNDTQAQASPVGIGQGFLGSMSGVHGVSGDCDWFHFEGAAGTTIWLGGSACGETEGGYPISGGATIVCGVTSDRMPLSGVNLPCGGGGEPLIYTLPASGRYDISAGCSGSSMNYSALLGEFQVAPASVARDHRDVVLAWSADGGANWSPKTRANDCLPGCEDAIPALAVDHLGRMHLTWYDRRDAPQECNATVHTYWRYSEDGGVTLRPAVRLSETAADLRLVWASYGGGYPPWPVGDSQTLTTIGERVHAFWTQPVIGYQEGDIHGAIIEDDGVTGTEVLGFGATWRSGTVRLWWKVRGASSSGGFRVHRASGESEQYAPLNGGVLISPNAAEEYELEDATAVAVQRYRYRLEVVRAERSLWQGPIEVESRAAALRLTWQGGRPNPFSGSIELSLMVPKESRGTVTVYDVTGHEVRRLHRGRIGPGESALVWDGRDGRGRKVPAGVYLVQAAIGDQIQTRRVVRMQ